MNRHLVLVGLLTTAIIAASVAVAAPLMPRKKLIPDEVKCLSGIRTVQVVIDDLPPLLESRTHPDAIRPRWEQMLKEAGFQIESEQGDPDARLVLQYFTATDGNEGVCASLTTVIAVHQRVHHARLDEPMTLPVASVVITTTCGRENAVPASVKEMRRATTFFERFVRSATASTRGS